MAALTNAEKHQLEENGYSKSDLQEISRGIKKSTYHLVSEQGEPLSITENEAIERLGREEWVRGVSISAFRMSTTRYGLNRERITIHTKNFA